MNQNAAAVLALAATIGYDWYHPALMKPNQQQVRVVDLWEAHRALHPDGAYEEYSALARDIQEAAKQPGASFVYCGNCDEFGAAQPGVQEAQERGLTLVVYQDLS